MILLIIAKIVRSKTPILFADIRRMNRGLKLIFIMRRISVMLLTSDERWVLVLLLDLQTMLQL